MTGLRRFIPAPDVLAVLLLVLLWSLFFWRLITPIREDQASLAQGDFSAQFVTFAGYQYARFAAGEIPLWNPYNNAGLPFIADTQAAVFYPPRLLTVGLAQALGGWSYNALQIEMMAHVLAYTLMLYALMRRMTLTQPGSVAAGLVTAIIGGYGGFMTGYPPLQLALLEAAIWLPLVMLGIHEATRDRLRPGGLLLAGVALGLSWLAGHPQTSYFLSLLTVAYYAYRIYDLRAAWTRFVGGVIVFGGIAFGLAAVQLLPGIEYLRYTARSGFGYDAKDNGFPVQDIVQFIYPGVISLFSPLYVGITALVLAMLVVWQRIKGARFWGGVALFGLVWSLGGNSVLYPLLYNVLPGLRFFRGQERAAFLVAGGLAILAGLGMTRLAGWDAVRDYASALRVRVILHRTFTFALIAAMIAFVAWLGNPVGLSDALGGIAFGTIMIGLVAFIFPVLMTANHRRGWLLLLIGLIAFELFTVTMDTDATYDPMPAETQIAIDPPPLIAAALADTDVPFRVDGARGLGGNFGSLYRVADIRGISPLFLAGLYDLIEDETEPSRAWEVLSVRYVYTDWETLPVPSRIIERGTDAFGPVSLHRLDTPRPFALLVFDAWVAADAADALSVVRNPAVDVRRIGVVEARPPFTLDVQRAPVAATVTDYRPESFTVNVRAPADGLLTVSLPFYPGWHITGATDLQIEPVRTFGALTGIWLTAGDHTLSFVYDPITYRIGAILTLTTLAGLCLSALFVGIRAIHTRKSS